MDINANVLQLDEVKENFISEKNISLKLLRLDLIHSTISGNKYFKILPYLQKFKQGNFKSIITFGGAYSNYLHALAYVCFINKIKCTAYIRGENIINSTLQDCINWGMQLQFLPRKQFDEAINNYQNFETETDTFLIPFGGNDETGLQGLENIIKELNLKTYDYLFCSIGTGTTILGFKNNMPNTCTHLGFMATKDMVLETKLQEQNIEINNEFTIGGFAKTNATQIEFIKEFYFKHHIMLDIVYTSKMMIGIYELIKNGIIPENAKCLAIHTGGLQGNRSCKELQDLY
jgi:1-aminocyclopropane-1-carboxylate deaminase